MPIKIPNDLPARVTLEPEGVMVMSEADAVRQDIRPLRIGLLNLMPNKIRTETQFARLIGATPLQVELTLVKMTNHVAEEHAGRPHDRLLPRLGGGPRREVRRLHRHRRAGRDAAVRGGDLLGRAAPDLRLDADQCARSLQHLLGRAGGPPSLPRHAQAPAGPTRRSASTATAISSPASPYLRGFSDDFSIPVSRWTEVRRAGHPGGQRA